MIQLCPKKSKFLLMPLIRIGEWYQEIFFPISLKDSKIIMEFDPISQVNEKLKNLQQKWVHSIRQCIHGSLQWPSVIHIWYNWSYTTANTILRKSIRSVNCEKLHFLCIRICRYKKKNKKRSAVSNLINKGVNST